MMQVAGEGFIAAETNARNEPPYASENIWQHVVAQQITWVREAEQLYHRMRVLGFPLLRLHDAKITLDISKNPWNALGGDII